MKITETSHDGSKGITSNQEAFVSEPISGADLTIGTGFKARSFAAQDVGKAMDPLVMVDHYLMTESTFGVHPHAGMSAVSLLFDDSEGYFHNRDSLGNNFDLQPGDLYWLSAGSGAVHDEAPRTEARIHGLQVFVNVPQAQRFETPTSRHVRSIDMPVIRHQDYCVKVALGESHGRKGAASPSNPMTVLDGKIKPGGHFLYEASGNQGVWIQNVKGNAAVVVEETTRRVTQGQAVAIKTSVSTKISIKNTSLGLVHFALFDGAQIAETYVQDGPFVMGSREEIAAIKTAYKAGQFGRIPENH